MKKEILASAFLFFFAVDGFAQLSINEIMQSNVDCIMDDCNEFPDSWVELFNIGNTIENLSNYRIGLSENAGEAWPLPAQEIAVGGAVLVYCDKSKENSASLHTNFRLESGKGGAVYLFKNGELVERIENLKKQPAPNISYGRLNENSNQWGYQYQPTPGEPNCGKICEDILGNPMFSIPGRVYETEQTLQLELTVPNDAPEGTSIFYTLDGSEPTVLSTRFIHPITISSNTIVRAKLFCDGYLSPRSVTQSYLFHGREVTLPVISIVSDKGYFYDEKIGILVDGTYNSEKQNYKYDWRRPINFEYFESNGTESELNQLCETRVAGNSTRKRPLKSLCVYANKRFGTKRLQYEFFPDQCPGITDFKSIMLRNSGDDFYFLYMRDAIIQRTMGPYVGLDWQAWSPAIIYINGEYKGMLNIRERSNEDNIYTHYDGLEDIDMVENGYKLKEGDWENLRKFMAFIQEEGHTVEEYEQWMDVDEYRDLMIMHLFYNNIDYPGNNVVLWRPRTENGRWRFIAKDADLTMGRSDVPPSYNIIEWLYNPDYDPKYNWGNNSYQSTMLFRRLMDDSTFFDDFIDRNAIYMGDFLRYDVVCRLWDQMYNRIKFEIPYHRSLYPFGDEYDVTKYPFYKEEYTDELQYAKEWLNQRHIYHYKHLADFYHIGEPCPLIVNQNDPTEDVEITMNGVKLQTGCFDGRFFAGRDMVLEATAKGKDIYGWKVVTIDENGSHENEIVGNIYSFKMPQCSKLIINPVLNETTGINNKHAVSGSWAIRDKAIEILGVENGKQIELCDLNGYVIYKYKGSCDKTRIPLQNKGVYILRIDGVAHKIFY